MSIAFSGHTRASRLQNLEGALRKMNELKVTSMDEVPEALGSGSIVTADWWWRDRIINYRSYHPDLDDKTLLELAVMHEKMGEGSYDDKVRLKPSWEFLKELKKWQ